jgi:hypothetical protein
MYFYLIGHRIYAHNDTIGIGRGSWIKEEETNNFFNLRSPMLKYGFLIGYSYRSYLSMVLAGIRKGYDGPIEFNAPIAYPKHQKGAAPGKQVGDLGTPSISVTAFSLCFLAPPLVPSAERQAGQAPIL